MDPETVVVVTHVRARGKGSGITVEAEGAGVWQVRDGKIVRARSCSSRRPKRSPRSVLQPPDGRAVERGAGEYA